MRSFVFISLISASLLACSSSNNNGPRCGDGVIQQPEECDDGAANGTSGDSCSSSCTLIAAPVCGDGHVDPGESCDDGANNGTPGDHCSATCTDLAYVTANWSVDCVTGTTGCTPGCPTGFDTAQVVSQEVDSTGTAIGAPKVDLFNCVDMTGKTSALPPGLYQEYVSITSHDGTQTFAQSLLDAVDLTSADGTFTQHIYINGGYFHWSWTLVGALSGNPLTCAQVPNQNGTEIIATSTTTTTSTDDIFTCTDGEGTTDVLPVDTYTLAFDIINNAMPPQALGTSNPKTGQVIMDTNHVTEVGSVQINVTGQ